MFSPFKKPIAIILFGILSILTCSVSCKKDISDVNDLYAYTSPGNAAYNVLSGGAIYMIGNTPVGSINTSFPVLLTRAYDKTVEVVASIDTSLVKVYDSIYNNTTTSSTIPPSGAFELKNGGKVTINAGQTSSQDSLQIELADASKLDTGTHTYIIPIVLNSASNGIPTSTTRQVMYVKMQVVSVSPSITSTAGASTIDIILENQNGINKGQNLIYLLGMLNATLSLDFPITVKEDTSLLQNYNKTNNTNYQLVPTGSFQLTNASIVIPANYSVSPDSISIKLTDLNIFSVGTDYLLPIRIVKSGPQGTEPSNKAGSIVYIRVHVFVNNIDSSDKALVGSNMDRSNWIATSSSSYSPSFAASNTIDGDIYTDWIALGVPNWLQIDMGSSSTVKGFNITPDVYDDLVQIQVTSSQDGIIWNVEGLYHNDTPSLSPQPKTIKFINPVSARYFRFNIISTNYDGYAGMTEIYGIQ